MKISQNLNQAALLKENVNAHNSEKSSPGELLDFKSVLDDTQFATTQVMLQELIHKFEKQEKTILSNPTITNLYEYKKIIKEVLNVAVANHKCEEVNIHSGSGYQKQLSLNKIIDEKVGSIIDDFISNNKLSLESISNVADIKGLILDVFA